MTQMVTRAGSSDAPTGVVTVGELLTRYAPDPIVEIDTGTGTTTAPVSVGSLLRREGRAPHAPDRPLAPRARTAVEAGQDEPRGGSGVLVRRSALAAGTLLAAGSVFGATVVTDSSSTEPVDRPQTGYAGEGRLDLPPNQDLTIPTVVDTAAQTDQLDPGDPAPTSWSDVAFPSSTGGDSAPTGEAATPSASRTPSTGAPSTAAPAAAPVDQAGSSDDAAGGSGSGTGGNSGGGNSGGGRNQERGTGLGTAVQDLGEGVGGPVGRLVGGVGGTVSGLGNTLAGDEPSIVGNLAGGLLS